MKLHHWTVAAVAGGALLATFGANAAVIVSTDGQDQPNPYTVLSGDLLETALASTDSVGSATETGVAGLSVLNNGAFGTPGASNLSDAASLGASGGVTQLTYTFDTTASPLGYNIASVATYVSWGLGRTEQDYTLSYATVAEPTVFIPLGSVVDWDPAGDENTRVIFSDDAGDLASGVAAIRFGFGPTENGWAAYREIDVVGEAVPEPASLALMSLGGLLMLRRRGA